MASTSSLYGGLSASIQGVAFTASTTYSPMFDCKAMVYVIGAGGGGATAYGYASNYYLAAGSGGAAGGCATSLLDLKAADTYTLTIGAGGISTSKTVNQGADGGDGGNTTFVDGSGTISTMTGNGGAGGNYQAGQYATQSAAGASGGTATGGTLANVTGGGSGSATLNYTNHEFDVAGSGGGAVGVLGAGHASGAAYATGFNGASTVTGGAGIGGSSGSTSGTYGATGGGSANGPSADADESDLDAGSPGAIGIGEGFNPANALSLGGSGGDVNAANGQGADDVGQILIAQPGGGGGCSRSMGYEPFLAAQGGGLFAGGGAMNAPRWGSGYFEVAGGAGGLGGGGGAGTRTYHTGMGSVIGGFGGNGVVVIQILEKS